MKVNFPEVPRGGEREMMGLSPRAVSIGYKDSSYKIYAGNLGWTVTSDILRDAFSACSGLVGAKVIYERDSGRSRGFGFVNFASAEDCQAALQTMDGKVVALALLILLVHGIFQINFFQEDFIRYRVFGLYIYI